MDQQLLISLIRELLSTQTQPQSVPFEVGKKYFIRTVTYHLVGEVEKIVGKFIVLKAGSVAWVADSGRFMQAINQGALREVEPVDVPGFINTDAITDAFLWEHDCPRKQV